MLIEGRWTESARKTRVTNPYTGEAVGEISQATREDALRALADAKAFRPALTAFERAEILSRAADALEKDAAAFVASISSESGMCLKDARKEVQRASALLRVSSEEAKRIDGRSIFTDGVAGAKRNLAVTVREPVGLVLAITPFNRPLNQVVVKLGPAIAAGCRVLLKPSEKTPLTALKLVRLLLDCGLPTRMISVVTGDPREIGDVLVTSPSVDMITFTGSQAVGERIARAAGMIKTAFELGDSGALIVMEDADLKAAASAAAAGAYGNAGQSCRGVKRILVHKAVEAAFADALVAETKKWKVGDPRAEDTDIGTLISEEAAAAVEARVRDAVAKGARVAWGGKRNKAQLEPVVVTGVPRGCDLVALETFGPAAPIVAVESMEDAVSWINSGDAGLQAGVFTKDLGRAMYAAERLEVGAVMLNNGPQFDSPFIPFGGVKKSGLGREGVRCAIEEMTTVKTIVF